MAAKSVFEQNVKVFPSLHFSEDPLPRTYYFNGQNGSFRVTMATQDNDYSIHLEIPADNVTLDISAVGHVITVSLASAASVPSTTTAQLVDALNDPATYPAIDGLVLRAELVNYSGINDGSTVIPTAPVMNFYNEVLDGLSVDHTGYCEGLVVVDIGNVDHGVSIVLSLQHSDDDSTFVDLVSDLATLTSSDAYAPFAGLLRFNLGVTTFKRYLRVKAVITGASDLPGVAQVSVVFLLAGRGYFDAEGAQEMAFVL